MNKDLTAYALQYTCFLIENIDSSNVKKIKEIILFGSVTREEATKKSDVDIFVNIYNEDKPLAKKVETLTKAFFKTEFYSLWKLMGIKNEIKPIVGVLDKWKELAPSIIANGIVLFGKYTAKLDAGQPFVIIYWTTIKSQSKRVLLSKQLYGYSYHGKKYIGLLEKTKSRKISSNCITVALENARLIFNAFKAIGVSYKVIYAMKV